MVDSGSGTFRFAIKNNGAEQIVETASLPINQWRHVAITLSGSVAAANYLYGVAAKDGTVFGTFSRGIPMEPLIGTANTRYEADKFTWIGSISNELSVCALSRISSVKTFDDALTTDLRTTCDAFTQMWK